MKKGTEIILPITEEALAVRKELLDQKLSSYLKKDGFEPTRQQIMEAIPAPFPEVETRNTLVKGECDGFNAHYLAKEGYENIILYIHGGAWVFEMFPDHVKLCDDLVDKLNAKVYMPMYPLAPKYSYKDTYKMVVDLYDEIIKEGKPVFVMGDSAGGTLTLGLTHIIKETGRKMPEKIVALSPATDLSFTNPESVEIEKRDPLDAIYGVQECAKIWAQGTDVKDPALSALYRDVSGYPDTLLLACSEDILTPDIIKFYEMMEKADNNVTIVRAEGHWHVFCTFMVPERETFLDIVKDFCLK